MFVIVFIIWICHVNGNYLPNWPSIDSRPLPDWYDEGKFGIFNHFGPYAVPGQGNEWFWYLWREGNPIAVDYMKKWRKPRSTYADFAESFTTEMFDADNFASIIAASGASVHCPTTRKEVSKSIDDGKRVKNDSGDEMEINWCHIYMLAE